MVTVTIIAIATVSILVALAGILVSWMQISNLIKAMKHNPEVDTLPSEGLKYLSLFFYHNFCVPLPNHLVSILAGNYVRKTA
jgi:hypothetical protein